MTQFPERPQQSVRNLQALVEGLRSHKYESPWLEFKSNLSDPNKIGKYISGLANSAALSGESYGYIVWGIEDSVHSIQGTDFDHEKVKRGNQALEPWLASLLQPVPEFKFMYTEL